MLNKLVLFMMLRSAPALIIVFQFLIFILIIALLTVLALSPPDLEEDSSPPPPAPVHKSDDKPGHRSNDVAHVTDTTAATDEDIVPLSVNYHFTRRCNLSCGFCFHIDRTGASTHSSLDNAKRALSLLAAAGMRKLNFAGGEPLLYPSFLSSLLRYCKEELKLESTSIVTNGSKLTEKWLAANAKWLDILAVSCDSFDEAVNYEIGRHEAGKPARSVSRLYEIRDWCAQHGVRFKVNSVITALNCREDMASHIEALAPFRWKVFQVLTVPGENDAASGEAKGDIDKWTISDEEFGEFCDRHKRLECFVPESNDLMAGSYLVLDEDLCFLDKGGTIEERKSASVLEVGVQAALRGIRWDQDAFRRRGGVYDWGRDEEAVSGTVAADKGGCTGCPSSASTVPRAAVIPDLEDMLKR